MPCPRKFKTRLAVVFEQPRERCSMGGELKPDDL